MRIKLKEYKELICVIGVVILVAAIIFVRKYNGNKTDKVEDIHIDVLIPGIYNMQQYQAEDTNIQFIIKKQYKR